MKKPSSGGAAILQGSDFLWSTVGPDFKKHKFFFSRGVVGGGRFES